MNSELVRQRVKFAIEHGETYPGAAPLSKPLAVKLTLVLIALQVLNILIDLFNLTIH